MTELESEIIKLEESLFSDEVRASKIKLEQLIADEFIEVASSGIRFGKKEVLERLPTEAAPEIQATDYEVRQLADDSVMLLYQSVLKKHDVTKPIYSHRCSIWTKANNQWQMVYHQGTKCEPFEQKKK
ncbi:DUF4440 domain-containing protein [Shewanella sp. 202IG2-18]|uniref:nuclear transport factor 2 family protein n=1 Tax=Parashewanella hymeniacidonis TaxID=2807618 RepID=UPI0019615745|nr:DUF4440 domain-containing protein [Parashewanella hymeniacidonis]MBM7074006.1 DUF4440 domain-containing protein [Parashewanella hymeniacidonis]